MQALDVGVDGMRRDAEGGGNGKVGAVVENTVHDLQFTRR